jgi:hypothetical protein
MKRLLVWVALALPVALGCENKKAAGGDGGTTAAAAASDGGAKAEATTPPVVPPAEHQKPKYADTSALWALAPADATLGFVVADGVGSNMLNLWSTQLKKLQGKPFAKKTNDQIDAMRKQMPFDVFDENAYKAKGFDISKGLAVFVTADVDKPALIVLPAGDLAALRKTLEMTTEKVGDREIDKSSDIVCTMAGNRYACAPTVEQIDAAMKAHDSPLAAAVKALPADSRGDVEFYADAAKMPKLKEGMADLKPFGDFNTLGAALRFSKTDVNLVGWGQGAMGPIGQMLVSTSPPAEFASALGNAVSVVRIKIDPKVLAMSGDPPVIPLPDGDKIALAELLTGDVQIVTAGKGLLAGALLIKVTDAAKAKKLVGLACSGIKGAGPNVPVANLTAKEDSCSGEISLASLKDAIGAELPPYKFNLAVNGNVLSLLLGDVDAAALKGTVTDEAGSPEAKEILTGAQTFSLWSRDLGIDTSALPKELAAKLTAQPDVGDAFAIMSWWGAQSYDVAVGLNVSATGFKIVAHGTTFESDPADARAALEAAYEKRVAGDRPGYLAALGDLEKKFPGTMAAHRAKLERTGQPMIGPLIGVAAGVGAGAYYFLGHIGGALSGGFGEPGAHPTPGQGGDEKPAEKPAESKPAGDKPPAEQPSKSN